MKVLAFGEILWDIIDGNEHLGGAPFNFSAHSAQCGNESYIISRIGDDDRGMKAYNKCMTFGVNNTFLQWDKNHPTGFVDVQLNNGQPDYTIAPEVAYDYIEVDPILGKLDDSTFDIFYFGSLAQRSAVSAGTLNRILTEYKFLHVFYDVNLRKDGYNEVIVRHSLAYCTIFKLNNDEVPVVSQLLFEMELEPAALCQAIRSLYKNVSIIIITASDKGCYIFENDRLEYCKGKTVTVNDAVGAGDAFSAAFMHAFSQKKDALLAASVANEIGAFVATQAGAIPSYPPAIKELLSLKMKTFS